MLNLYISLVVYVFVVIFILVRSLYSSVCPSVKYL